MVCEFFKKKEIIFWKGKFRIPLCGRVRKIIYYLLYMCHIFQLSRQNDEVKMHSFFFQKITFFFKKLPFSSSSTSRPEKNSAIDGQKKGDVTSPTSSQNSEKHLTEAELKVSIVLSMYITNKLFMLL